VIAAAHSMLSAASYGGLPELTPLRGLTEWRFDPGVALFVIVVALSYRAGVRRVRQSGLIWSRARVVCVAVGLAALIIDTMSFVGAYAHTLFWVYAMQIVVMLMVIPLFFALGMPVELVLQAVRPERAARLSRALDGWAARLLAFPVTSSVLMVVVPFAVYFTDIYEASLRHYLVYELVHLLLVATGSLFFWSVIGGADVPRRVPFAVAIFIAFIELIIDALPGIIVRYTTRILAGSYYTALGRPWGPSLRRDQGFGGAVLWFVGEAVGVPVLAVLLARWIAEDRRESIRIDRDLDAAMSPAPGVSGRPAPTAGTADTADTADTTDGEYTTPWWETDPTIFGDRARRNGWGDSENL
jgi:cytochrome c oxidase assembly factor CtaG